MFNNRKEVNLITAYLKLLAFAIYFVVAIGFLIPALVSAKDTIAVMCGFAVALVITPIVLVYFVKYVTRLVKAKGKE